MRKFIAALLMLGTFSLTACDDSDFAACPPGQHQESHVEYTYHYGYNYMTGKYEFFFGPETINTCEVNQ